MLFRSRSAPVQRRLPAGVRAYAIGDVHGRLDLLDRLLTRIADDERAREPADSRLIFLGDLIDRGPDSRGVVARIIELARLRPLTIIQANHEDVFLRALEGSVEAARYALKIGGAATFLSYVGDQARYDAMTVEELVAYLPAVVPADHIALLAAAQPYLELGDYVFVHAGIRPGVSLAAQDPNDLMWIRQPFLESRADHGRLVIHGHSVTDRIDERANRIGIDTGAYATGILTAIGLEGDRRWFLDTGPPD